MSSGSNETLIASLTDFAIPVKSAIVWRLVAGLLRRPRAGLELAATILRPCDGQYRCVSLVRRDAWTSVAMMNLYGTSLLLNPVAAPRLRVEDLAWRETGYLVGTLQRGIGPVIDDIEALLGLPRWAGGTPSSTPTILTLRLIAAVMQHLVFSDSAIIAEAGYEDAGYERESWVHDWVAKFPDVHASAMEAVRKDDRIAAARRASRVWRLRTEDEGGSSVLLDLGTAEACTFGEPAERVRLDRWYARNGRELGPLVAWVVGHLQR